MAYLFNGDRAKALPLFEQAAAADPANFDVRMAYARALRDERKYPAAAGQFVAALKLKPADLGAWNDLASMLYLVGDFPQALAALDKARGLGGETAGNCFMRAIMLDEMKQLKPALAAYREFLSLSQGKTRPGMAGAAAVQAAAERVGQAMREIRASRQVSAFSRSCGSREQGRFTPDLKQVQAEPNLEKRSKLALENAAAALQAAREAYRNGETEKIGLSSSSSRNPWTWPILP